MRASESIITIVENLVSQMTPVVTITANVDNGDGTFTLSMCPTYWLMPNMTITIDGNDYVIDSFVQDTSITVSGSVQPAVTTFQLAAPEFRHGARRKVNNERQGDLRSVWVYLPIPEILEDNNPESDISYTADIRPIFLKDYNEMRDTIELQQDEVIEPLNAAADYFVELINDDYATFNEPPTISRREWMNFGNPTVWGNDELIFDQPLSGVETRMSLEVLENGVCSCDAGEIDNCPDVTTSVEGVATTSDTAPGQNIDIQIVDDIGNTVASTLITDTPNTKKLQVSTAGDPVQNSMNGTPLTEAEAGTTKTFVIQDADANPVTVTQISDSATAFVGEVDAVGAVYYNRPYLSQTISYNNYDHAYRRINGANDYNDAIPANGMVQQLKPDNANGRFDYLLYFNKWGHKFRFTGINGGYYDEADGNYYDVNGVLSTKSAEFVEVTPTQWFVYDHLTGYRWQATRGGAAIWVDAINNSIGTTYNGSTFDGINQTGLEALQLVNSMDYNQSVGSGSPNRPFFDYQLSDFWTSDTPIFNILNSFTWQYSGYSGYQLVPTTKSVAAATAAYFFIFDNSTIPQP